jgi:hypothetical protein
MRSRPVGRIIDVMPNQKAIAMGWQLNYPDIERLSTRR